MRCDAMEVSAGTRFHQCVYLRVVPTEQLANAHALAARAFGLEPGNGGRAPYMPHLSLVYGDLTETEREHARKDARRLCWETATRTRHAASFAAAAEVSLRRTDVQDLSCESWSRVDRYPLPGGRRVSDLIDCYIRRLKKNTVTRRERSPGHAPPGARAPP